jgi:hypothetical protein
MVNPKCVFSLLCCSKYQAFARWVEYVELTLSWETENQVQISYVDFLFFLERGTTF